MEGNTTTNLYANNMYGESGKKKSKKKYIIGGILLAIGLLWALADALGATAIASVKNGHLSGWPDVEIGDAFEDFFANTEWESFKEDGDTIVEFRGECTWYDESADAKIQFTVEDDEFEITYFRIGEDTLNSIEMVAVLAKIMEG